MGRFNLAHRLRLASGLVLFAYVATHLANHGLGLISLAAMETGRGIFLGIWRWPPMTAALYGSLAVHLALALWALYRRRSWRGIRGAEILQLVFGFTVPPLLAGHVLATRGLHELYGLNDSYAYVINSIWIVSPYYGFQQTLITFLAWVHGCIGLHYWLRLKPWYRPALPWAFGAALLAPVLALLGFAAGGREVERLMTDPQWAAAFRASLNLADMRPAASWAYGVRDSGQLAMGVLLALVLLARFAREIVERGLGAIILTYPMKQVRLRPGGASVLEISRQFGIPHASVCGGRGRCSTCRVRVGAPPDVRLACQIRPKANLAVTPLLPPNASVREAFARPDYHYGNEREIVVLFADLRGFTGLAEGRLPYDVVFLLNQYFRRMGRAVEDAGGRVDKFIGDGVMALFGVDDGAEAGARQALNAARAMGAAVRELNTELAHDLPMPLRIGIGLHCGPAIVGEMGYGRTMSLTAIGDTVNSASRIEAATKDFDAELVFSARLAERAGMRAEGLRAERIQLRGRAESLMVYVVAKAETLPVA
jgi:adenylate cyclase